MDAIIRGKYLITDPELEERSIINEGAVYISGNTIVDVGKYNDIINKWPNKKIIGDGKQLLMPGIIDSHSHGRGLTPIQKGVPYDFLENNLLDWAYMKNFSPEITSTLCALRHIRSGSTTIHNNGFGLIAGKEGYDIESIEAYLKTGIRLAYSLAVRNRDRFILDSANFAKTLPEELLNAFKKELFLDEKKIQEDYFVYFNKMYSQFNGDDTKILLSPGWAQGCSEELLLQAKEVSDDSNGIPVHMHCLQTPIQKEFSLRKYGKTAIKYLEDLGVLNSNVVLGHAIWVTEEDINILAEHGVSITTHPTCNLAMRNALAPVYKMNKKGITVAMGMDDKTLNDDEDALLELRVIYKLHRIDSFDLESKALDCYDVLKMGTTNGAKVLNFTNQIGAIKTGMKADMILIDLDKITEDPMISSKLNIIEILINRGLGRDVNTVIINGEIVMKDREVLTIDIEKLYYDIRVAAAEGIPLEQERYADKLQEIKPYFQKWYNSWINHDDKALYNIHSSKLQ